MMRIEWRCAVLVLQDPACLTQAERKMSDSLLVAEIFTHPYIANSWLAPECGPCPAYEHQRGTRLSNHSISRSRQQIRKAIVHVVGCLALFEPHR
jgi:hypothetical protein